MTRRVGLIGYGYIGRQLRARIAAEPWRGLALAFVHNRSGARVADLPAELVLTDLSRMAERAPDLVVEAAHPAFSRDWGEAILRIADYMPLSVAALADDGLRERLVAMARAAGRRLILPHGALMGLDSLREWRHAWSSVTITFRKAPENIDFADSGLDPRGIVSETVVYDGPARGIAARFPRNINTMVTCALATTGLDECRARLVAVPGLTVAIAEVEALGHDGARLTMRKEQPVVGVSGTEMFESVWGSICRSLGVEETLSFA